MRREIQARERTRRRSHEYKDSSLGKDISEDCRKLLLKELQHSLKLLEDRIDEVLETRPVLMRVLKNDFFELISWDYHSSYMVHFCFEILVKLYVCRIRNETWREVAFRAAYIFKIGDYSCRMKRVVNIKICSGSHFMRFVFKVFVVA